MKTLFEKLKPAYKAQLEIEAKIFPNICESTKKALQSNYYWSDLNIVDAKTMCDIFGLELSFTNLHNLFKNEQ